MQILSRPELGPRTTLGLGGRAQLGIQVTSDRDWEDIPDWLRKEGLDPLVIGHGSNLLIQEGELPLLLIKDLRERHLEVLSRDKESLRVLANTACPLQVFLSWLQDRSISGLEGLVGIPGSLGGAIAMNAGAFDQEINRALSRVQIWTPEHGTFWLDKDCIQTAYREFVPNLNASYWVITHAEFALAWGDKNKILEKMRTSYRKKKRTQPLKSRTCGCVFKNPHPELPAGYLLDKCGFRGYMCGKMAYSKLHANFMINTGKGRSEQAFELIRLAREEIYKKFSLQLENEIQVLSPQSGFRVHH